MYVWHWVTRQKKWVRQPFCPQFVHNIEEEKDMHSASSALEGGSTSAETLYEYRGEGYEPVLWLTLYEWE